MRRTAENGVGHFGHFAGSKPFRQPMVVAYDCSGSFAKPWLSHCLGLPVIFSLLPFFLSFSLFLFLFSFFFFLVLFVGAQNLSFWSQFRDDFS